MSTDRHEPDGVARPRSGGLPDPDPERRRLLGIGPQLIIVGVLLTAFAFSVDENVFGWETRAAGIGLVAGGIAITWMLFQGRHRIPRRESTPVPARYRCPHCGQAAIDGALKLMSGPAKPRPCGACGRKIGVSWIAILAVVPLAAALVCMGKVEPLVAKLALIVGGMGLACVGQLFAPLKPR